MSNLNKLKYIHHNDYNSFYLRNPKTLNEKKQNQEWKPRAKRGVKRLRDSWDDIINSVCRSKSWKINSKRRKQYKISS